LLSYLLNLLVSVSMSFLHYFNAYG